MEQLVKIVQERLGPDISCAKVVECVHVDNGKKLRRFAAIVEKQAESGLFLFASSQQPCSQPEHLSLETVVAVDAGLRCQAEARSKQDKQHEVDYTIHLKSSSGYVLLEMPRQDATTDFLTEIIKRSKATQSMSKTFSDLLLPRWFKKYGSSRGQASLVDPLTSGGQANSDGNCFDPLRHMNITEPGTVVPTADLGANASTEAARNVSSNDRSDVYRCASRDSLDRILDNQENPVTMESALAHQGLSIAVDFLGGAKAASHREKLVRKLLCDRQDEFTDLKYLKVFCGSWNVNGQSPPESLQHWLAVDDDPPDIYAIGFQELDLSKEAFIFTDSPKEAEWQIVVKTCLNSTVRYKEVKSIRLVGVMLIVYIQEKHMNFIDYVDADYVATGIMGFMGNKGGVAVRFNFHSSSLCFVNSHLAAHQDEYERRNSDYRDIITKTKFKRFEPALEVSQHDIVFWVGDLNYRIDLLMEEVKSCIRRGMYDRLLLGDQLYKQMKGNTDVFKGFKEGNLNFDPTYKFDPGTDNYDSSEKNRVPAWCDRILWLGSEVTQLRYSSHPQLKVSDHKPVSAVFNVGVRVVDQKRFKKVYEDTMKKMDRMENDYLPQIKLDKTECVFKDVKFSEPQSHTVTIANIGQVLLEFEFVNKLSDSSYSQPWLKATPSKSIIDAGHCCEVNIEVLVDKETVAKLNAGEEKLEDILVLHLVGGKDSFITINGNYLVSSFGSSIEALIQMHGPIREVPVADLIEIEQPGSLSRVDITQDGGRLYMVPKEIWKLVDFLHKYGLTKTELFQQSGRPSEFYFIRDCLDTGKPNQIPETLSVHSVAESFLLFLECLAQPVIPYEFYSQCLASSNNLLLSRQLLVHLPDCHKNTFLYICAFLRELLKYSDTNGLDSKFLSAMFGEVMLRPEPVSPSAAKSKTAKDKDRRTKLKEEEAKKAAFMYHFISHDVEL